jgi:hypothetical protein
MTAIHFASQCASPSPVLSIGQQRGFGIKFEPRPTELKLSGAKTGEQELGQGVMHLPLSGANPRRRMRRSRTRLASLANYLPAMSSLSSRFAPAGSLNRACLVGCAADRLISGILFANGLPDRSQTRACSHAPVPREARSA